MEIIQDRKRILIQEEATGTKGAAGKDLLTLLIRANVHDKEGGMSDEAVLARKSRYPHSSTRSVRLTLLSRNTYVLDCWTRNDECRFDLDPVWIERESGGSEEAQRRALNAQYRLSDNGRPQRAQVPGYGCSGSAKALVTNLELEASRREGRFDPVERREGREAE